MQEIFVSPSTVRQRANILVVEDDRVFREKLCCLLSSRSHNIRAAGTLADARQLVSTYEFDLGILDIQMPDGLGFEIASEFSFLPVLFISGIDDHDRIANFLPNSLNTVGFVSKPVSAELLDHTLTAALTLARFLRCRRNMMRLCSYEIQQIREEFSAILHDSVGQRLVGLSLMLENTATMLDVLLDGRSGHDEVQEHLKRMIEHVRSSKREISDLVRKFDSLPILYQSLDEGIRNLVSDWSCRTPNIEFVVDFDDTILDVLDDEKECILYQVIREAVTNAIDHARPDLIRISMHLDGNRLSGSIEDNGIGIAPDIEPGFGMQQILSRIDALEGTVSFERLDSGGTSVRFEVPINKMPLQIPDDNASGDNAVSSCSTNTSLVDIFLDQANTLLDTIENPDSERALRHALHTLASSADVIGDRDLANMARELENLPMEFCSKEAVSRLRSAVNRHRSACH